MCAYVCKCVCLCLVGQLQFSVQCGRMRLKKIDRWIAIDWLWFTILIPEHVKAHRTPWSTFSQSVSVGSTPPPSRPLNTCFYSPYCRRNCPGAVTAAALQAESVTEASVCKSMCVCVFAYVCVWRGCWCCACVRCNGERSWLWPTSSFSELIFELGINSTYSINKTAAPFTLALSCSNTHRLSVVSSSSLDLTHI